MSTSACPFFNQPMKEIKEGRSELKEKAQYFSDHVEDLLESYYKLGVLNITEKAAGITSITITMFAVTLLAMFTLLFISFGLAWWLGDQWNNMLAGFSTVAGVFILLVGLLLALRRQVIFPLIRNTIIKKVYE